MAFGSIRCSAKGRLGVNSFFCVNGVMMRYHPGMFYAVAYAFFSSICFFFSLLPFQPHSLSILCATIIDTLYVIV